MLQGPKCLVVERQAATANIFLRVISSAAFVLPRQAGQKQGAFCFWRAHPAARSHASGAFAHSKISIAMLPYTHSRQRGPQGPERVAAFRLLDDGCVELYGTGSCKRLRRCTGVREWFAQSVIASTSRPGQVEPAPALEMGARPHSARPGQPQAIAKRIVRLLCITRAFRTR